MRESIMGRVSVQGHRLICESSTLSFDAEVKKQKAGKFNSGELLSPRFRKQWRVWEPVAAPRWRGVHAKGRKGRAPFYVVWDGRTDGLFYCWRDVKRSIAGLPEARVRGYSSLARARAGVDAGRGRAPAMV